MKFKDITKNLGLKLFSLFLAILLWFHAVTEKTYTYDIRIPLSYTGLPDTLFIINEIPRTATITLTGRGKELLYYSIARPKLRINLRDLRPGRRYVKLTPTLPGLPQSDKIKTEDIRPERIPLVVDKLARRRVKVKVTVTGSPPKGHVYLSAKPLKRPYLYGPSRIIADYAFVKTEPINLKDMDSTFKRKVRLLPPRGDTYLKPDSIEVLVQVDTLIIDTVQGVSVSAKQAPSRYKLNPSKVSIICEIPRSLQKKMKSIYFLVLVNLKGLKKGKYELVPEVKLKRTAPKWIKILGIVPPAIEVIVK